MRNRPGKQPTQRVQDTSSNKPPLIDQFFFQFCSAFQYIRFEPYQQKTQQQCAEDTQPEGGPLAGSLESDVLNMNVFYEPGSKEKQRDIKKDNYAKDDAGPGPAWGPGMPARRMR